MPVDPPRSSVRSLAFLSIFGKVDRSIGSSLPSLASFSSKVDPLLSCNFEVLSITVLVRSFIWMMSLRCEPENLNPTISYPLSALNSFVLLELSLNEEPAMVREVPLLVSKVILEPRYDPWDLCSTLWMYSSSSRIIGLIAFPPFSPNFFNSSLPFSSVTRRLIWSIIAPFLPRIFWTDGTKTSFFSSTLIDLYSAQNFAAFLASDKPLSEIG
mmetsp:Transcript_25527/g.40300  ORF Transcript_25527/g.40300 Transcript_25527/m.40300 type:complete len:213 (-) Transcript_25527:2679-3317(-)